MNFTLVTKPYLFEPSPHHYFLTKPPASKESIRGILFLQFSVHLLNNLKHFTRIRLVIKIPRLYLPGLRRPSKGQMPTRSQSHACMERWMNVENVKEPWKACSEHIRKPMENCMGWCRCYYAVKCVCSFNYNANFLIAICIWVARAKFVPALNGLIIVKTSSLSIYR